MVNKKVGKTKKGFSLSNLSVTDWLIMAFIAVLILLPDPIDFLTLGLPVVESIALLVFAVVRSVKSLRS